MTVLPSHLATQSADYRGRRAHLLELLSTLQGHLASVRHAGGLAPKSE